MRVEQATKNAVLGERKVAYTRLASIPRLLLILILILS